MKTVLVLALVALFGAPQLFAQTHQVNVDKSTLKWHAKKVTGEHNGNVKIKDGQLTSEKGTLTGNFTFDMPTIADEDITNPEYKGKLEGHLKSEDFFSVAKFPTSTFKITKAVAKKGAGNNNYEITGDLTIKGITKPITFPAELMITPSGFVAKAKFQVNRVQYDIKYNSASIFSSIGDKAIDDNFDIDLYVVSK